MDGEPLLESSWWMSSAKLGSSPHQKSQSSLRPGVWWRRHTLSTSAFKQRLKLHRMGSSSVTGKTMGDEVGPCHTKQRHLMPVRSACGGDTQQLQSQHRSQTYQFTFSSSLLGNSDHEGSSSSSIFGCLLRVGDTGCYHVTTNITILYTFTLLGFSFIDI